MATSIGVVASALFSAPSFAEADAKPLNVLMIAVDDLNNWVGAWGGPAITPNIDALANSGTRFQNGYSAVPACGPSRIATMTGLRPEVTGHFLNEQNLRDLPDGRDIVTLPQFFRKNGYEAVAAGKIFHHPRGLKDEPAPLSDPISWDYQAKTRTGTGGAEDYIGENGWAKWHGGKIAYDGYQIIPYIRKHGIWGPIKEKKEETGDFETAQFCADYLAKSHDKPFFLACGIFRPHSPQLAPQEFFDMYPIDDIKLPEVLENDMDDIPAIARANWSTGFAKLVKSDKEEWKRAIQAYLASTSFADAAIGKILDGLNNSPYKDNTVVVLWGDHGFQLGTKERWEKFTLWHQGSNTPYIIKVPGVKPSVTKTPVSLVDLYPTLVDITGFKAPKRLSGHSLLPLMKAPDQVWQYPAITSYQEGNNGIRWQEWNYIRYRDGAEELYNLKSDPNEYHNLANEAEHQALIQELRKWLPKVEVPQTEYRPMG
ncbi:hypothetical protein XM47_04250 [Catenovulum maritimum]|uniref:Sulfatase N-terminal domain-containing protein n=1 Tax=Catenovulum maritimum TaxID=1513271 RepID=A0A0J8JNW1_9ALTE|nr:hypothetical protein XM47_04250 [Catenovulum maritimum]